ncbi:hypothetical protein QJS83_15670 [Bdellovibrio sp. 22V]|uniref:hypothetical protein n=1 Tax=Bdellovibrio TaxID=958 RepID=UPI002543B110|nr:hypothetical protein [Bdellovibrio sp. 22V]WII71902.1 hypothetical protein QJS83_15670 [Bdellovibrio sp. 22V]
MKSALTLALVLLLSQVSLASGKSAKNGKADKPVAKKSQLGTSFRFSGSSLRGKYQTSMGTAATVENDKLLEDLLKGRTQFEDRQEKETERN